LKCFFPNVAILRYAFLQLSPSTAQVDFPKFSQSGIVMTQKLLRLLCCILFVMSFVLPDVFGQQRSPYKNLQTAAGAAVYDTIAGINLDVNESNPQPQHGELNITILSPGGSGDPYVFQVEYVPDAGFVGVDTFVLEYRYASTYPFQIYRGFRVCVLPSLLTAKTDYATTPVNTPVTIGVLANDNAESGPLTVTGIPLVNNGTASINANNEVVFTPNTNFTGVAHLNYTVCDALNTCLTGSAHIGVHHETPDNDSLLVFTNKNQTLEVPLTYDGYTSFQAPANGIVTLVNGNSFRYAPNAGFSGSDQFVLKTTVNGVDYFKTVQVKVFNNQSPNLMAVDDVRFTPKNQAITFNVRDNDLGNLQVRNWTTPNNFPGTLSNTNGSGNVTFTPNSGFSGVVTFTYKIGNSSAPSLEMATVTVIVDNLALPENLFPYKLSTPKETPMVLHYEIPYTDFDFTVLDEPDHGDLEYFPGFTTHTINGQSFSGNNLIIVTPEAAYTGYDNFTLLYCAPNGGECVATKIEMDVVEIAATAPPFCITDCAWPGDANNDGVTNNKDLLPLGYVMGQNGIAREEGSQTWYGQFSENWADPFLGLPKDIKHVDADGGGVLTELDILAIHDHYNQAHNIFPKPFVLGKGLPFSLKLLTPNPQVGDLVRINIELGSEINPAYDIYGFIFDMTLSNGVADSAFKMTFFDHSWLNLTSPSISLAQRPSVGRFEMAYSRTNGQPVSGYGPIGQVEFIIIDIIEGGGQNSRTSITLNPSLMLSDGSTTAGAPIKLEFPIKANDRSKVPSTSDSQDLLVYPSPAQNMMQVSWQGSEAMETLTLMDLHGKVVLEQNNLSGNQTTLNVAQLPSGLYVLSAKTAHTVATKRVQILR